jgi:hypothetical protein
MRSNGAWADSKLAADTNKNSEFRIKVKEIHSDAEEQEQVLLHRRRKNNRTKLKIHTLP